jgi:DNA-directed RNA polymerase specialized sigma24 family protein
MGLGWLKRTKDEAPTKPSNIEAVNRLYTEYFPRVYAFVHSCVGGDVRTQDIVVQSFSKAFSHGHDDEERFCAALFRSARKLCKPALKENASRDEDSLTAREREVLALVFDAGFTREEIASIFRMRESNVSAALMTGLRKLKSQTSPAAAAAYLKLA